MKIIFFEIQGWEKGILLSHFKNLEISFFNEPLSEQHTNKVKDADIVSVFIYSQIKKNILTDLQKTKLITTRSTGFDHIDGAECKKKGITVCNVPFYGENTVAEHTFALILSLTRNIHKSYLRTIRSDFSIDGLKGSDIKGKTLGVIGAGHIGMHVIKIAKGFGMKVLAYDVNQNNFLSEVLDFQYSSLEKLLSNSDIITIHAPHNASTHHLINKNNIQLLKKGAMLINTARGEIIETGALINALDDGSLSGAGLDVLEGEDLIKEEKQLLYDDTKIESMRNLIKDHLLLSKENVVYTPHIAFYSEEALQRILKTTIENIQSFIEGKIQNEIKYK